MQRRGHRGGPRLHVGVLVLRTPGVERPQVRDGPSRHKRVRLSIVGGLFTGPGFYTLPTGRGPVSRKEVHLSPLDGTRNHQIVI